VEKELRKLLALDTPTSNLASDKGLREEVRGWSSPATSAGSAPGRSPSTWRRKIDRQLADLEGLQ